MARQRSLGIYKNQVQAMKKRGIKPEEKIFHHIIDKKIKKLYNTHKQILSKEQTTQACTLVPSKERKVKSNGIRTYRAVAPSSLTRPLDATVSKMFLRI